MLQNAPVDGAVGQRLCDEMCCTCARRRRLLYFLFVIAFVLAASTLWRFSQPTDFYFSTWIASGDEEVEPVAEQLLPDAPGSLALEADGVPTQATPAVDSPSSTKKDNDAQGQPQWRPFLTHRSAGGKASHWCVSEFHHPPLKERPGGIIVTRRDVEDAQKHCSLDLRRATSVPVPSSAENLHEGLAGSAPFYNERLLWGVDDAGQCLELCLDQHPAQCAGVVFRSFHHHGRTSNPAAVENLQLSQHRRQQQHQKIQENTQAASNGTPRLCVHKIDDRDDPLPLRIDATGRVPAHVEHTWCIRQCTPASP